MFICFVIVLVMGILSIVGLEGTQPQDVGDPEAKELAPCNESKENCVSSQATTEYHAMKTWEVESQISSLSGLTKIISEDSQAKVIVQNDNYIYVQYKSKFFKFVDDVEFLLTPKGIIEFRAAARLGQKDLKVNRKRIESLKKKFENSIEKDLK